MTGAEKKEMRELAKTLDLFRDQLLARHDKEPLKSPPLFLLTLVTNKLKRFGGVLVLIAALLLAPLAQAGRSVYEASGTVERITYYHQWLDGDSWDVYVRGDDGKLFMLHFHGENPLDVQGHHYARIQYVQRERSCETGYTDEIVSAQ